ncbi:MAG: carbohydrate-binding protein [Janthinobacterium lividum]
MNNVHFGTSRIILFSAALLGLGLIPQTWAQSAKTHPKKLNLTKKPETIGGGTVTDPAVGPAPSFGIGGPNMVLVKNWHFGTDGTIKNYTDMNANFQYHDQFNTFNNGFGNYGTNTVAPDKADALNGQPVEGVDSPPVRQFMEDSLKTFLTPLNGATTVDPNQHNAGCGSFVAKWKLPNGGSLLGRDIVWETRVRYVTPPYYWFALWTAGSEWSSVGGAQGAEMDLVESFGWDNGGTNTNYDGHYWHSASVATPYKDTVFYADWSKTMTSLGILNYDATQYHIWTWVYRHDDTFAMYVDGKQVQAGSDYHWTYGDRAGQPPINLDFLFDAAWGHTQVKIVDHTLPASAFDGKFYEFNYSRVYLSGGGAEAAYKGPHPLPGVVQAVDYDTGGYGLAYNQQSNGGKSGYRADNNGNVRPSAALDGTGYALGYSTPGDWYRYTVSVRAAGRYTAAFRVATAGPGGTFHLEDEKGRNLTGTLTAADTGGWDKWLTVTSPAFTLKAGAHTLRLVEDADGPNTWICDFDQISLSNAARGKSTE